MLLRLSKKIVSTWSNGNIIPSGTEEAYIYGVQLLLSTIINFFIIALISCVFHKPFAWIPFLIGFVFLRITAGGFHAKTPLLCSISFCGAYTFCVFLSQILHGDKIYLAVSINSIATVLAVYICSPVPASNKPLSDHEKKRNRVRSFVVVAALALVLATSIHLCNALNFAMQVSLGELTASVFLCFSKALLAKEQRG